MDALTSSSSQENVFRCVFSHFVVVVSKISGSRNYDYSRELKFGSESESVMRGRKDSFIHLEFVESRKF